MSMFKLAKLLAKFDVNISVYHDCMAADDDNQEVLIRAIEQIVTNGQNVLSVIKGGAAVSIASSPSVQAQEPGPGPAPSQSTSSGNALDRLSEVFKTAETKPAEGQPVRPSIVNRDGFTKVNVKKLESPVIRVFIRNLVEDIPENIVCKEYVPDIPLGMMSESIIRNFVDTSIKDLGLNMKSVDSIFIGEQGQPNIYADEVSPYEDSSIFSALDNL